MGKLLTTSEREIIELLARAHDKFIALPVQHPMHQLEFVHAIHSAQRLVMSRPVARDEGWIKTTESNSGSEEQD